MAKDDPHMDTSPEALLRRVMEADAPSIVPKPEPVYDAADLLRQEWLKKAECCFVARVSRATWDRYRALKASGDPAFKDFPSDYRNSPNSHLRFKTSEVVNWLNVTPA